MKMVHITSLLCALFLIFAVSSGVYAGDYIFDLSPHLTSISNQSGEARLLLDTSFLDTLECTGILDARIQLVASGLSRGVSLEVHPVTHLWDSQTVTWASPWDSAGGDFPVDRFERIRISSRIRSLGQASFAVTDLLTTVLEDPLAYDGLILVPNAEEGFSSAIEDYLTTQNKLDLVVSCGE